MTYEDINIVYEDNHLLAAVKPVGVPAQADETGDPDMLSMLKEYLKVKYGKPGEAYLGLVHRLDRPTGGIMVFAKTSKAASRLSESIRNDETEKKYLAVVVGTPREKTITELTNYLLKDSAKNMVYVVPMATEGAKKAVLDYTTIATDGKLSLISVKLHTGRAHQIRVQMSTLGNPLFGDQKYGQGKSPAGFNLALWAYELVIPHPTTKERMVFRVYPPVEEIPWKYFDINRYLAISIKNIY